MPRRSGTGRGAHKCALLRIRLLHDSGRITEVPPPRCVLPDDDQVFRQKVFGVSGLDVERLVARVHIEAAPTNLEMLTLLPPLF